MQGGTYARALEVGFDDKQATFFSWLCIDTQQELRDEFEKKAIKQRNERTKRLKSLALWSVIGWAAVTTYMLFFAK